MDGGVRRGSDVVKALALGAKAVLIGRAYLWGLAANGQAGVENSALDLIFKLAGVVGLQLATGKVLDDITAQLGHVAEGALCAHAMLALAHEHNVRAPITQGVCAILDGVAPQKVIEQLLVRDAISEH